MIRLLAREDGERVGLDLHPEAARELALRGRARGVSVRRHPLANAWELGPEGIFWAELREDRPRFACLGEEHVLLLGPGELHKAVLLRGLGG